MPRPTVRRALLVPAQLGALALFVAWFDPGRVQWLVESLWLLAVTVWTVEVRLSDGRLLDRSPDAADMRPLLVLLPLFAAAWLPFYRNWRWAYTGDSVAWFSIGSLAARDGLRHSLLSIKGVDENFTYLHGIAFNSLLFVFEPTLFWHRVGKLLVSCASLTAIYTYFCFMIGRWWALLVVGAVISNYVWLWFSYISYGHMDTYCFYFLTLTVGTLVWRDPDRLTRWLALGLLGGASIFFTQTAWSAVGVAGLVLGVRALAARRWAALAIYAVSFVLVALPILLQFDGLIAMTTRQAKNVYAWPYLQRIFKTILLFPYDSPYRHIGVYGGWFRAPLAQLYLAGLVLGALSIVPWVRRTLRLPIVAPLAFALLMWDVVLMTLTNNGYDLPSTKRAFSLIPWQIYLALLPFAVLQGAVRRFAWGPRAVGVLAAAAVLVAGGFSLQTIVRGGYGMYGVNSLDGLIELRQRFADRRVAFLTGRKEYREMLAPDGFFQENYGLADQVTFDTDYTDARIERTCADGTVLCYEPHFDGQQFAPVLQRHAARLVPLPLNNTKEMKCFECPGRNLGIR
jgi:hypothetical protein